MPRFKILSDTDIMPFGKYGKTHTPMQDVPAHYLHYLWNNGLHQETKVNAVADYINRNIDALKQEHPDGIWESTT